MDSPVRKWHTVGIDPQEVVMAADYDALAAKAAAEVAKWQKSAVDAQALRDEALAKMVTYGLALERISRYPTADSWECKPLSAIARAALGLPSDRSATSGEGVKNG